MFVCVRVCEFVYMFAGVHVCICVPGCAIWVCLFRVFFPNIMVQPGCSVRVYVGVREKFHSEVQFIQQWKTKGCRRGKDKMGFHIPPLTSNWRTEECNIFYPNLDLKYPAECE